MKDQIGQKVVAMEGNEGAILKAAEDRARQGGYNAFSFRSLADTVGIKSSSVHYYFPTKEDLGAALAERYTERFMSALGVPAERQAEGADPIATYVRTCRTALVTDKRMCLCGLLGAQIDDLPDVVAQQAREFFKLSIDWLCEAYQLAGLGGDAHKRAVHTVALLQGAMITSNVLNDITVFDHAVEGLTQHGSI